MQLLVLKINPYCHGTYINISKVNHYSVQRRLLRLLSGPWSRHRVFVPIIAQIQAMGRKLKNKSTPHHFRQEMNFSKKVGGNSVGQLKGKTEGENDK